MLDTRLTEVKNIIREWAGIQLSGITLSGSISKGTALHGTADCDLFISLKSDTTQTLGGDLTLQTIESRIRSAVFSWVNTEFGNARNAYINQKSINYVFNSH